MDRAFAEPLDVAAVAAVAHVSEAHFSRSFRSTFGETPHRYLQRRRVERAMFLLRRDRPQHAIRSANPILQQGGRPPGERLRPNWVMQRPAAARQGVSRVAIRRAIL